MNSYISDRNARHCAQQARSIAPHSVCQPVRCCVLQPEKFIQGGAKSRTSEIQ